MNNCIGVNNHRHFFLYIINLTLGILSLDFVVYSYFTAIMPSAAKECSIFGPDVCQIVNADTFTLLVTIWANLQLTWVGMLLFVQFVQVAQAMTTYENMFGISHASTSSLTSAFTSTGAPLDPGSLPPSGTSAHPDASAGHGHKHGGGGGGGLLKMMTKLLGVDAFVETATGRGAVAGNNKKRKGKNPYNKGCLTNCKDFWCDSAPFFTPRENGVATLNGHVVNYTEMYETPSLMQLPGRGGDRRGAYEAVAAEEV